VVRWPLPSVCEDAEGRSVERGYSVEAVNPPVVVTPSLPLGATGIDYIVRHGRQWRSDAARTGSVGWNPRFSMVSAWSAAIYECFTRV